MTAEKILSELQQRAANVEALKCYCTSAMSGTPVSPDGQFALWVRLHSGNREVTVHGVAPRFTLMRFFWPSGHTAPNRVIPNKPEDTRAL
jgi:hypothetical protein